MRASTSHLVIALAVAAAFLLTAAGVHAQPLPDPRLTPNIQGVPQMLQRVEQGVADVGVLSDTLRAVDAQVDLRSPIGFTNVYRVPGRPDLLMRSSGAVYAIFPQSSYVHMDRGLTAVVPAGTTFSIGLPSPLTTLPREVSPMQTPKLLLGGGAVDALTPSDTTTALRRDHRVSTTLLVDERGRVFEPTALERQSQHPHLGVNVNANLRARRNPNAGADEVRFHEFPIAQPPEAGTILRTIVTDDAYRAQRLNELLQRAAAQSGGDANAGGAADQARPQP